MSYQKRDWPGLICQSSFWYNNDKDLKRRVFAAHGSFDDVGVSDLDMDVFGDFDDDMFTESRERKTQLQSYNLKHQEPCVSAA